MVNWQSSLGRNIEFCSLERAVLNLAFRRFTLLISIISQWKLSFLKIPFQVFQCGNLSNKLSSFVISNQNLSSSSQNQLFGGFPLLVTVALVALFTFGNHWYLLKMERSATGQRPFIKLAITSLMVDQILQDLKWIVFRELWELSKALDERYWMSQTKQI